LQVANAILFTGLGKILTSAETSLMHYSESHRRAMMAKRVRQRVGFPGFRKPCVSLQCAAEMVPSRRILWRGFGRGQTDRRRGLRVDLREERPRSALVVPHEPR
jgi:hypothetical protein